MIIKDKNNDTENAAAASSPVLSPASAWFMQETVPKTATILIAIFKSVTSLSLQMTYLTVL